LSAVAFGEGGPRASYGWQATHRWAKGDGATGGMPARALTS
jgi:hypothetical protein